jgi:hypothetical protein
MPIHRNRISRKVKETFRKSMRNVIDGLSRKVLVYKQPLKSECPNCFYDKFTDSSTGKCKYSAAEAPLKQAEWEAQGNNTLRYRYFSKGRCPVCKGQGYIEVARKTWIDALVIWDPSTQGNAMTYTPAGTEGSTVVQLKTDPKYFDTIKNCSRIVVDGVECKISRPPILRGLGTQALLIITAFTTEKPKIASDEFVKDYS